MGEKRGGEVLENLKESLQQRDAGAILLTLRRWRRAKKKTQKKTKTNKKKSMILASSKFLRPILLHFPRHFNVLLTSFDSIWPLWSLFFQLIPRGFFLPSSNATLYSKREIYGRFIHPSWLMLEGGGFMGDYLSFWAEDLVQHLH